MNYLSGSVRNTLLALLLATFHLDGEVAAQGMSGSNPGAKSTVDPKLSDDILRFVRPAPQKPKTPSTSASALNPGTLIGTWEGPLYLKNPNQSPDRITIEFVSPASASDGALLNAKVDQRHKINDSNYSVIQKYSSLLIVKSGAPEHQWNHRDFFKASVPSKFEVDSFDRDVLILYYGQSEGRIYLTRNNFKYFRSEKFHDKCYNRFDPWISERASKFEEARKLKADFFDVFSGLDEQALSLNEMWSDTTFKQYFGTTISAFSDEDFKQFLALARDCALSRMSAPRAETLEGLVDGKAAVSDYRSMRSDLGLWQPYLNVSLPSRSKIIGSPAQPHSISALQKISSDLASASSSSQISTILASNISTLNSLPMADVRAILSSVRPKLALMQAKQAQSAQSAREAEAANRLRRVAIPSSLFPPQHAATIIALVQGKLTQLGTSRAFFGGVALGAIEKCNQPSSAKERLSLVELIKSSLDKSLFGSSFSSSNVSEIYGSILQGQSDVKQGADFATAIGCADPFLGALLESMIEILSLENSTPLTGTSVFVRTCSAERTQAQCECVLKEARSVSPNLENARYSRAVMSELSQLNPAVSLRIFSICRIGNY